MADRVIFTGWDRAVAGREKQAMQLFQKSMAMVAKYPISDGRKVIGGLLVRRKWQSLGIGLGTLRFNQTYRRCFRK